MRSIHVIGTGGTIASRAGEAGTVTTDSINDVLGSVHNQNRGGLQVTSSNAFNINSFQLRFDHLLQLAQIIQDSDADGFVITHGTDTMEETAFFLDVIHSDDRPIVLTGAQRAADMTSTDGPENLRQAILAAGHPLMRGTGATISFEHQVHAAFNTRKQHTLAPGPFRGGTLVAEIYGDQLTKFAHPVRRVSIPAPGRGFADVNVAIVDSSPGTDPELFRTITDHPGLDGVVLAGVGTGNAPLGFVDVVEHCPVPVVLATRVPEGPVAGIYGNGGAVDLLAAGAHSAADLNPYQARILLALAIHHGTVEQTFKPLSDES